MNDDLQIMLRIEVQVLHDAEAPAQRSSNQTSTGRRSDQSELRQLQLDGASSRALPDHDVQLIILHRRVEHLFNLWLETMNLVYEEDFALLQIGEQGR